MDKSGQIFEDSTENVPLIEKIIIQSTNDNINMFAYNTLNEVVYFLSEPLTKTSIAIPFRQEAIFMGKVTNINTAGKLAYVNFSGSSVGLLNIKNDLKLQLGSYIPCQLRTLATHEKIAKLSSSIKYIGKYCILLGSSGGHFFSKKILPKKLSLLKEKFISCYKDYGLIFRSAINSLEALTLVEQELLSLIAQFKMDKAIMRQGGGVNIINSGGLLSIVFIRNIRLSPMIKILTNNEWIFEQLESYFKLWQFDELIFNGDIASDLPEHIPKFSNKIIDKHGIVIEINASLGLNIIDINSSNTRLSAFNVNYLAINEVIKQIKLQDLCGIILIDFIKNLTKIEQLKIFAKINIFLENDWRGVQVLGFTRAGIFEIIRDK